MRFYSRMYKRDLNASFNLSNTVSGLPNSMHLQPQYHAPAPMHGGYSAAPGGLVFHPHHQQPHQYQQQPRHNQNGGSPTSHNATVLDETLLKACARVLRSYGMMWSQDAMQARSWKAASRMIDMYTQARTADDIVRWYSAMKQYVRMAHPSFLVISLRLAQMLAILCMLLVCGVQSETDRRDRH